MEALSTQISTKFFGEKNQHLCRKEINISQLFSGLWVSSSGFAVQGTKSLGPLPIPVLLKYLVFLSVVLYKTITALQNKI